jgi:myosin heavy subunit
MSMIARKPTLGSIFKLSLINLMDTIGGTNVHYIRCIKPNEAKVAWEFDPSMVLAQLRACGVLETIRISCAGYPSRWTFEEFADRYFALVSSRHWDSKMKPEVRQLCSVILESSIKDEDKFQVGTTKIFFRAGQVKKCVGGIEESKNANSLVLLVGLFGKVKIRSFQRMCNHLAKAYETLHLPYSLCSYQRIGCSSPMYCTS